MFLILIPFGCLGPFQPENLPPSHSIQVVFTRPGTVPGTAIDSGLRASLVSFIDRSRTNLLVAWYELSEPAICESLVRANARGVHVQFVGDTNERTNGGYVTLATAGLPMRLGNGSHLMHHKFLVADGRAVAFGSANGTDSGVLLNLENFLFAESPPLAGYFAGEFTEMFQGRFGYSKQPFPGFESNHFSLPDGTGFEVWFAPYTAATNLRGTPTRKLLDLIAGARHSLEFALFCFSREDLARALVVAHTNRGVAVWGTLDRGWHLENPYSMHPMLLAAGIPVRFDGNENHAPGDPTHGGKLHDKVLVVDGDDPWGVVVTGSLNWTETATEGGNDETCVVVSNNPWLLRAYREEVRSVYRMGVPPP